MGFSFGKLFQAVGSGLSSAVHTVGSGLSSIAKRVVTPIYNKVIKPAYNKVVKPVFNGVMRIGGKALATGEHIVTGGLDFGEKFVAQGEQNALGLQKGLGGMTNTLTNLLSNPLVMIGGGVLALVVVTKL